MTLLGNVDAAIRFGLGEIGKPYDHQHNARFGPLKYDCSGFVTRCLEVGGMPRGNEGFGDNSATMAQWGVAHPPRNIGVPAGKATFGALLIAGGVTGYDDAGHVAFSLGDGRTLESNGARGVCIDNANRMTWSHGVLAPTNYGDDDVDEEAKQLIRDIHGWAMAAKDGNNQNMLVPLFMATFDGNTASILHDINGRLVDLQKAVGTSVTPAPVPVAVGEQLAALRERLDALAQHLGLP